MALIFKVIGRKKMAYDALDIAYKILKTGKDEFSNKTFTNLQLVKLTYICHGAYMALHREPLIQQPVEAWKYGPVISSIYHHFKENGTAKIPTDNIEAIENPCDGDEKVEKLIAAVVKGYGDLSGSELIDRSHMDDSPWTPVWNTEKHKGLIGAVIPNEDIRHHYMKVVSSKGAVKAL